MKNWCDVIKILFSSLSQKCATNKIFFKVCFYPQNLEFDNVLTLCILSSPWQDQKLTNVLFAWNWSPSRDRVSGPVKPLLLWRPATFSFIQQVRDPRRLWTVPSGKTLLIQLKAKLVLSVLLDWRPSARCMISGSPSNLKWTACCKKSQKELETVLIRTMAKKVAVPRGHQISTQENFGRNW